MVLMLSTRGRFVKQDLVYPAWQPQVCTLKQLQATDQLSPHFKQDMYLYNQEAFLSDLFLIFFFCCKLLHSIYVSQTFGDD